MPARVDNRIVAVEKFIGKNIVLHPKPSILDKNLYSKDIPPCYPIL